MRSYKVSSKVKLGSQVAKDHGPGAFITDETLQDMMMEQRRAMIGGTRTYGQEYDDYYQDRRWTIKSKSPTFTPIPSEKAADATVKQAASSVAKVIVGRAKARLKSQAAAAGLGTAQQTMFLTPGDLQAAHFGGFGAEGKEMPKPETVDVVTAVKEIYGTVYDLKPLTDFVSAHPIGTVAILMMVIGAWAGLASFIGAGGVDAIRNLGKKG